MDFDCLGDRPDLHHHVHGKCVAGAQIDVIAESFLETGRLEGNPVLAGLQRRNTVNAFFVGRRRILKVGRLVNDADNNVRSDGARRVGDAPGNGGSANLRERDYRCYTNRQEKSGQSSPPSWE